jgi:paraquat-inducible protein B
MPEPEERPVSPGREPTTAKVKPHGRLSPVWLIPLVAVGLVAYLAYSSFADRGARVTLILDTADGLTVDQTQVKHKAVTVGTVESIRLAPDTRSVIVGIRMVRGTDAMTTDHARFWVVRPRLTAGSLTGLETLVSGAYIEVDPGDPGGKKETEFKALSQPPGRQSDEPGQVFVLEAKRLGALSVGSPVYYRDVEVGEVLSYDLGSGLGPVTLRAFVREPFDKFVHTHTRFWNASGLSINTGPEGMRVEVESLQTLLSGGIAFETAQYGDADPVATEATRFELHEDKAGADDAFYRENLPFVTYFRTSVQGLSKGSPVQISGVQVGNVTDVRLVYDPAMRGMIARVGFDLQPERVADEGRVHDASATPDVRKAFSDRAMRVTLESSNLLTGAKDLAIVLPKERPPRALPKEGDALVLPSEGRHRGMTASLADIATRSTRCPSSRSASAPTPRSGASSTSSRRSRPRRCPPSRSCRTIAEQMSLAAKGANGALGASGYGPNSDFQHNMERLMREVNDAARSFRVLADYLDRHPKR